MENPTNELISKLRSKLSPEGRNVLEDLEESLDKPAEAVASEAAMKRWHHLPEPDKSTIQRVMVLLQRTYAAEAEEHAQAEVVVGTAAAGVVERAGVLLRSEGEEPDENMTVATAIEVVQPYGEEPPEDVDLGRIIEAPTTEPKKIEHKQVRVIVNPQAKNLPEAKRENKLLRWADALYSGAMLIAAAGVLETEGSLEKAASVLWWAGFKVPDGYFPDDHEAANYQPGDEEALRLWVEQERERIEQAAESNGFYLAATGRLLDKADKAE